MSTALVFEAVDNDDRIARVFDLASVIWPQHYTPLIGRDQVDYMLRSVHSADAIRRQIAEGIHYELLVCGEDCGYIGYGRRGDRCFLSKCYVLDRYRGQGFGKAAMERVRHFARQHRLNKMELTVNKGNNASISFYQRQGWRIVEDIRIDIGDGYVMNDHLMQCQC